MDLAGYRPTLSEVAGLFGKSSRWISDLRAKGELPGDGATLGEFVTAWSALSAGTGKQKPIDQAKARREAAKADREEILTAKLKQELLPRDHVAKAVQGAFARVRSRLLSIPSKVAPRVSAMKSAVEIEEAMTELVHEALAELAATTIGVEEDGGIEEAGDRGGDRDAPGGVGGDGGGGGGLVAGADPAAATDGEPVGGPEPVPQPRGKRRTG